MTPPRSSGSAGDHDLTAQVMLRPIATPLTLGFLALGVASLTASGLQLGWIRPVADWSMVGLILLCFVVPLQIISAIFGFLARDAVASTGMGLLAGTWLAFGAATLASQPGQTSPALGLLLLGSATALLVPAIAGLTDKGIAATVIGLASLRFFLTGAYEMTSGSTWELAAGAGGLLLSLAALYAAFAYELESVRKHAVLPTGRRGLARLALQGSFADEVAGIHHEPGVRQQL